MRLKLLIGAFLISTVSLMGSTQDIINGKINKKVIATSSNQILRPTDLDFNPQDMNQLWVLNHGGENGGTTVMITDAGTDQVAYDYRKDGNAWHFMVYADALAFGDTVWATTHNYYNANRGTFGGWCGPSMWPSDLDIYAIAGTPPTNGVNGSHYDMVHQSPYSSGIAHESENTFWVNDGVTKSISRYKFNEGHIAGGHDHSDAQVFRYIDVPYEMNAGVPAHMEMMDNKLYYINPGTKSVNRLDILTGDIGNDLSNTSNGGESLAIFTEMVGADWETVVGEGLISPSGIDINEDYMIVSDNATGEIIIYDSKTFEELSRVQTGATSIMGIKLDPNGDIYYVDNVENEVVKIEGGSGINYFVDTPYLNLDEMDEGTAMFTISNSTDEEVTVNNVTALFNSLYASESEGLSATVTTPQNIIATKLLPGESVEVPVSITNVSGSGIYDVTLNVSLTGEDDMSMTTNFIGSTYLLPLVYVYDDSQQNLSKSDLTPLLNTTNYGDHIVVEGIDFRKYVLKADRINTVIWNSGTLGTINAHEYTKFRELRESGTDIVLIGDGSILISSFEETFNLDAYGTNLGNIIYQGFSTGGQITLTGVSTDPIGRNFASANGTISIQGQNGYPTTQLIPKDENAHVVFHHSSSADSSIAVRHDDGNSRSFVMSLNLNNITDATQRADIFKSIMDWTTEQNATGIFELSGYEEINVYPNPTVDYVTIDGINDIPNKSLSLLDLAGNTIRDVNSSSNQIDVTDLTTGTYFIMIKSDTGIQYAKFIKN